MALRYPSAPRERTRWILARRPPRNALSANRPIGFFVEEERAASGAAARIATILLANRECPWKCLMCDLWRQTLPGTTPASAISAQIDYALERLPSAEQIKLYNSGSFFDRAAIPPREYGFIADRARAFARTIVESHPSLIGPICREFHQRLGKELEIAMGLEIAHPEILERLNKGLTLDIYTRAAKFLRNSGIHHRAFILVKAPFLNEAEGLCWTERSIDFAFACGAGVVSLIPTRFGNGALEALAAAGQFSPPVFGTIEAAHEHGIRQHNGRVFVDLWDLEKFSRCRNCGPARITRIRQMNLQQAILPRVSCRADCPDATV